jgi:hypothetical protein
VPEVNFRSVLETLTALSAAAAAHDRAVDAATATGPAFDTVPGAPPPAERAARASGGPGGGA